VLLLDQVILVFVAFDGNTVAVKVMLLPAVIVALVLFKITPVTAIGFGLTVTLQVAVFPLADLAVIVTVPTFLPVTLPLLLTVAMLVLLLDQVIFWLVAFDGDIVAVSVILLSTFTVILILFKYIFSTFAFVCFFFTVILHDAVILFAVLTVMIAGFCAQGIKLEEAACCAVYIHGIASEIASKSMTEYCVLASDLIKYIPLAMRAVLSVN